MTNLRQLQLARDTQRDRACRLLGELVPGVPRVRAGLRGVGVSVDSQYTHLAWKKTPTDNGGIGPIRYPLVADLRKEIARDYGVLFDDEVALRGLFLIDREGIVRHSVLNDLPLGRNVGEALRMLDALRFHEEKGDVCPANWHEGDDGMNASPDGVVDYLSKFAK